jgi:archaellum component FlaC
MQQITAAFEADDHLRLLELQLNLLSSRDNVFATFNNAQLKYFNQTLQKQVQELEQEFYFTSPEGNGNPYGHLFSLNRTDMLRNIERQIQDHKNILKGIQHNLKMVQEPLMFKDYIRDFELDYGW